MHVIDACLFFAGLGTIEFSVHYDKQHSQLQVTVECAMVSERACHKFQDLKFVLLLQTGVK